MSFALTSPPLPQRLPTRSTPTESRAFLFFHLSGCARPLGRENVLRLQEPKTNKGG